MTTYSLQRSLLTVTKVAFLEKYNCNQIFLIVISPFNLIQIPVQDLTKESFHELDRRLSVDKVGLETVFRYFCVEVGYIPPITRLCFSYEADCTEFSQHSCWPNKAMFRGSSIVRSCWLSWEGIKPISVRPVLSTGEVETLRAGNFPTTFQNNVVVLVQNDNTKKDLNQKIEGFFEEWNSRNDVTVIGSSRSEKNCRALNDMKMKQVLVNKPVLLEKELKLDLLLPTHELLRVKYNVAELREKMRKNKLLVEEQLKENKETKTIITSTIDSWIQNKG